LETNVFGPLGMTHSHATVEAARADSFRPVWVVEPGGYTGRLCNASSGVEAAAITFIVEKLGSPH
jgi:CubicO group peptidase (beta-lactamase class C family)